MRQPEQLGFGPAVLCAKRVVRDEALVVVLADNFVVADGAAVSDDLICEFEASGKSQLSVMKGAG